MASKYNKFDAIFQKVPVQYGHLSKRERRCRNLGYIGSLMREPYTVDQYYRIDDGEIGAGRFFYRHGWKGDERGNIDKNGSIRWYISYTTYAALPDEIKKKIKGG